MAFRVIQGGEIRVNTTTDNTQFEQSIAALDDGGWIVTWRDSHKDGNGNGIFQQRYAADGSTVGVETQVNTTIIGASGSASGDRVVRRGLGRDLDVRSRGRR